jgi:N-acetylneuraminic acid mutarotase
MRKKHEDAQKFLRRFRKQISALDRRFLHAWKRGILTTAKKVRHVRRLQPITKPLLTYSYNHARISSGGCALLILVTASIPMLQQVYLGRRYQLDAQSEALVGYANMNLAKKLTYDSTKQVYRFNKDGLAKAQQAKDPANPVAKLMAAQVGGEGKDSKQLYSLDVSENLEKGITVYDNNLGLSFTMKPEFSSAPGRMQNGRLVFPIDDGQAVYSLKGNGLKEDILLSKAPKDGRLTMAYNLNLPQELEAKPIDGGGIGIYSADPALYGNISFGDAATQFKVMQSRKVSPKNNLVFTLPAPFIKQSNQKSAHNGVANFVLRDDELILHASQLDGLSYPITIDPSTVVDSTSGLFGGNNVSDIDPGTTTIKRGGLTGAEAGTWNYTHNSTNDGALQSSGFTNARYDHATVVSNGFIYVIGGMDSGGTYYGDVQYAALNSDGTVGTWASTNSIMIARRGHTAVTYNGYIYVLGGVDATANYYNDVQYALICTGSNSGTGGCGATAGTVGSWHFTHASTDDGTTFQAGFTLSGGRYHHASTVYNGYIYVLGGADDVGGFSDVRYAPLNGNGTVGTWNSTASLGVTTDTDVAVAYKGYIYIYGPSTSKYAFLNANGTISSWSSASALTGAIVQGAGFAYDGYLYLIGGVDQYAPIYGDGSIGVWKAMYNVIDNGGRNGNTAAAYNGYMYMLGGNYAGAKNDVQFSKINPAGETSQYGTTTSFTGGRSEAGVVAYNGYIYVIGGYSGSNLSTTTYAPINADGSLGTWVAGTSLAATRRSPAVAAYNGYIYVMGGFGGSGQGSYQTNIYYATLNTSTGAIGTWTNDTTTVFSTGRMGAAGFAYNGYLYIAGGKTGTSTYVNDIQYSSIMSAAAPGSWSTATATFTTTRAYLSAVVSGGRMYVAGGMNGSGSLGDIQMSPIDVSGNITTAWTSVVTDLNGGGGLGRNQFGLVVWNNNMYVVGGNSPSMTSVRYAPVNSDGTLGTFTDATPLPTGVTGHGTVAYNGYLYAIGGVDNVPTYHANGQYASLNNGGPGTTGTWSSVANSLPTVREGHKTVAYGGHVYLLGGYHPTVDTACNSTSSNYCNDVRSASILTNGTLGSWVPQTSFPNGRDDFGAVINNGYIYIIGGQGSSKYGDVQFAQINPNNGDLVSTLSSCPGGGTLTSGTWCTTTSLPDTRAGLAAVTYNGYLYTLGGAPSSFATNGAVLFAKFNADGSLVSNLSVCPGGGTLTGGTWCTTTNMVTSRSYHTSVAYNGYVYSIGGDNTFGDEATVEYAPLNVNGTVGTWKYTSSLPTPLVWHTSIAANGFLYAMGGSADGSVTELSSTLIAAINSNGSIGAWQKSPTQFSTARFHLSSFSYYNRVFVAGGSTGGSTDISSVQSAPLYAIPRVGTYSKLVDLGSSVNLSSLQISPTIPDANFTYKAWDSTGVTVAGSGLASSVTSGGGGGGGTCGGGGGGGGTISARYVQLNVVLDDSQTGQYVDAAGTPSSVSSLTINYTSSSSGGHPPPNQRLHGGKVLQAGGTNNLALDTCGV